MSPENRSNEDEAMQAEAERWLQLCGCCDAGIIGASCVCPPGEPRNVIGWALQRLAAVERERDALADLADELQEQDERNLAEMSALANQRDAAVADNARLLARVAAVEAAEAEIRAEASEREPEWHSPAIVEDARALALRWACKTIRAALAASPTPTGPEPEAPCTAPPPSEFEPWALRCEFPAGHDGPHRDGPHEWQVRTAGPATPTEPTEETP